ncbi:hypothetical protein Hanom_Chr15g01396351 [Helianthus anomalus]
MICSLVFSLFQFSKHIRHNGVCLWSLYSCAVFCLVVIVNAEDPYRFFTWNVTYGDIYPMGIRHQTIPRTGNIFCHK